MKSTVLLILMMVVTACVPQSQGREPLRIGAILPQTGPVAEAGSYVQRGIELAVGQINTQGGIKDKNLTVVWEDDQCNPTKTVSSFQKLATIDKVAAIVGPFCSGPAIAAGPVADQHQVVMVSPGAGTPEFTQAGDFAFRVTSSDIQGMRFISGHLKPNYRRIGVIYVNNKWGADAIEVIKQELGQQIVAIETFADADRDFRTQIEKLKAQSPDVLLTLIYPAHYEGIQRQINELKLEVPLIAAHTFEGPWAIKLGDDARRWRYEIQAYDPLSAQAKQFIGDYQARFGEHPSVWSAFAFDATMVLAEALRSCSEDASCIKDTLYAMEGFQGVTGTKDFDQNGDIGEGLYQWKQLRDGKFVPIDEPQ